MSSKRYWATPPQLMKTLQDEFQFDYDPCPHPRPEGYDGLEVAWGSRNWVNPPFTGEVRIPGERKIGPMAWVRKSLAERDCGKLVVLILPIYQVRAVTVAGRYADEVRYMPCIRWLALEDGEENPAPDDAIQPCLIFVFRPREGGAA